MPFLKDDERRLLSGGSLNGVKPDSARKVKQRTLNKIESRLIYETLNILQSWDLIMDSKMVSDDLKSRLFNGLAANREILDSFYGRWSENPLGVEAFADGISMSGFVNFWKNKDEPHFMSLIRGNEEIVLFGSRKSSYYPNPSINRILNSIRQGFEETVFSSEVIEDEKQKVIESLRRMESELPLDCPLTIGSKDDGGKIMITDIPGEIHEGMSLFYYVPSLPLELTREVKKLEERIGKYRTTLKIIDGNRIIIGDDEQFVEPGEKDADDDKVQNSVGGTEGIPAEVIEEILAGMKVQNGEVYDFIGNLEINFTGLIVNALKDRNENRAEAREFNEKFILPLRGLYGEIIEPKKELSEVPNEWRPAKMRFKSSNFTHKQLLNMAVDEFVEEIFSFIKLLLDSGANMPELFSMEYIEEQREAIGKEILGGGRRSKFKEGISGLVDLGILVQDAYGYEITPIGKEFLTHGSVNGFTLNIVPHYLQVMKRKKMAEEDQEE